MDIKNELLTRNLVEKYSDEHRSNTSKSRAGKPSPSARGNKYAAGRVWRNNEMNEYMIKPEDAVNYKNNGFQQGRLKHNQ